MPVRRILFLCTANSARSQIAEGLARHYSDQQAQVFSAGAEPGRVHPMAIEVMAEVGIDLSTYRSKGLDEFLGMEFDDVVTVCDRAAARCPVFPGAGARTHWSLVDPAAAEPAELRSAFRETRDELDERIRRWLADRGIEPS
jgi:arsenate reductase